MEKIKKIVIFVSIVFLILFLNWNKIYNLLITNIMSVGEVMHSDLENKERIEKSPEEIGILYNNSTVVYDKSTNTIYIPQSIFEEEWDGKIQVNNGKLRFESGIFKTNKKDVIREGNSFRLYWIDNENYCEYNLVFSGMPVVSIKTEGVNNETEGIWDGTVEVYDIYRKNQFYRKYECMYNIRGASTRDFPKNSYKVELKNTKASILGMRTDDDWIFNALYDDAGLIHNKISMEVWEDISAYNSVKGDEGYKTEYAEVFVDNQYNGVYLIGERVDEKQLELNRKDILYKCRAMRIPQEHNYTNEMTDGMLPIFWLKYPEEDIKENWRPIKNWVDCFLKFQITDYEEASKLLNMENAIDYNLFCLLIGGDDNTRKNVFFTAKYQENGKYQLIKNPWDLNAAWGNRWTGIEEGNNATYVEDSYDYVGDWSSDISSLYYMDEEKVSFLLYERWKELRENSIITEAGIDEKIDAQFSYLYNSGAYKRNYEKWTHGVEYWSDSYIYDYVERRIPFLDEYFKELYEGNVYGAVYKDIDYTEEFEARYYWEANYDVLSKIYDYDKEVLLEHYVYYGKPYGMQGRPSSWNEIPVRAN